MHLEIELHFLLVVANSSPKLPGQILQLLGIHVGKIRKWLDCEGAKKEWIFGMKHFWRIVACRLAKRAQRYIAVDAAAHSTVLSSVDQDDVCRAKQHQVGCKLTNGFVKVHVVDDASKSGVLVERDELT